jgi:excisionase family DNA binding protein
MKKRKPPTSTLLNIEQTAKYLNLKISKIRTLVFNNEIPVIRINRLLRFDKEQLAEWIDGLKSH